VLGLGATAPRAWLRLIPTHHVEAHVLAPGQNREVLDAIVGWIAVDVMDELVATQVALEVSFHDRSVEESA
jgi:hypothetical protein